MWSGRNTCGVFHSQDEPLIGFLCIVSSGVLLVPGTVVTPDNGDVDHCDIVLDQNQLREVTMNNEDLMREVLEALVEDTARQVELLRAAIREANPQECARLAHYSKGACANVGANRGATILKQIEKDAIEGRFQECAQSLASLAWELDLLRSAALAFQ